MPKRVPKKSKWMTVTCPAGFGGGHLSKSKTLRASTEPLQMTPANVLKMYRIKMNNILVNAEVYKRKVTAEETRQYREFEQAANKLSKQLSTGSNTEILRKQLRQHTKPEPNETPPEVPSWIRDQFVAEFNSFNREHFGGKLRWTPIMFADLGSTHGQFDPDGPRILLNSRILDGSHSSVRSGKHHFDGRVVYLFDTLHHEMLHLALSPRGGHGHDFCELANRIGRNIGVADHKVGEYPNCLHWPQRHLSYFGRAVTEAVDLTKMSVREQLIEKQRRHDDQYNRRMKSYGPSNRR